MPDPSSATAPAEPRLAAAARSYWRANLALTAGLLALWFLSGLGAGVLWAEPLNGLKLPGTAVPLGFWMAQQGSIIVFVVLILVYALAMNRLDARHHREVQAAQAGEGGR